MKPGDEVLTWNAAESFNQLLIDLSRYASDDRKKINEGVSFEEKAKYLEDWYESIECIFSRSQWFLNDQEIKGIQNVIDDIENITNNAAFMDANLGTEQLTKLRNYIKKMELLVHNGLGNNGMLGAKKQRTDPAEAWL